MHISDGVLNAPILLTGVAVAVAGVAVGLKKMDYDRMPQTAILSAAFFLATLVHVPIGPSSVHLILSGLLGLLLGWAAFPAILIGLVLQAVLFQFGGLTVLGVNTAVMALPAVGCYYLFGRLVRSDQQTLVSIGGFLAGFTAILGSSLIAGSILYFGGQSLGSAAVGLVTAHLPVMIIEGFLTMVCVGFLKKVKPEVLNVVYSS